MKALVSYRNALKAEPYLAALRSVGVEPVGCVPGVHTGLGSIQGIVFTGGGDIVPAYYGQQPHPELGEIDPERDAFELGLLTMADAADLPALCICRGAQLLNVHRGGTLVQHLPQSGKHRRNTEPKSQPIHSVRIEPGSKLAAILKAPEAQVNSRHHQAVDRLGEGLVATARDPEDNVIEALEDPARRFLVGVQWHPEDQAPQDEIQRRLFSAFAESLQSLDLLFY
jgi:gamma-glutamyl-gamma-aminobutyrate hydrolase PuuD